MDVVSKLAPVTEQWNFQLKKARILMPITIPPL
jgi:hypothetical protein